MRAAPREAESRPYPGRNRPDHPGRGELPRISPAACVTSVPETGSRGGDQTDRHRQSEWDRRHLATISTHVKISQAEAFKEACRARHTKPYRALRKFVLQYTREALGGSVTKHCPKNGTPKGGAANE